MTQSNLALQPTTSSLPGSLADEDSGAASDMTGVVEHLMVARQSKGLDSIATRRH